MKTATAEPQNIQGLVNTIVDYLSRDPLCLEIRHYPPAATEVTDNDKLHLLVLMERELKQAERRERIEELNRLAADEGQAVDVIFSSPKVWRDLRTLVSPFTRIEKEGTVVWQRQQGEGQKP